MFSLWQEVFPESKMKTENSIRRNLFFIKFFYTHWTQLIEKYFVINENLSHILLILQTDEIFLQI